MQELVMKARNPPFEYGIFCHRRRLPRRNIPLQVVARGPPILVGGGEEGVATGSPVTSATHNL